MKRSFLIFVITALAIAGNNFVAGISKTDPAHWPQWRGPFFNGMARTEAPVEFGDNKNIKWKVAIPGRGFSTPVIWEDRIYLTTAVPTGKAAELQPGRRPSNPAGGTAAGEEHKFIVMCLDRKTGKLVWERVAKVAAPHEGYHRTYGS